MISFGPNEQEVGERVDVVLAARGAVTRTLAQRALRDGAVLVNGAGARPSHRLEIGDVVEGELPEAQVAAPAAENIGIEVRYRDEWLLVISKPPGLVTHPARGHDSGTLVNALLGLGVPLSNQGSIRPGIVHRLDKDTSGLMVVAKTDAARAALVEQFAGRTVLKEYLALVHGHPAAQAVVDAPIGRDPRNRQRMGVVADGRPAQTEIAVVETFPGYALVQARLRTGRTHQIRVHLAFIGHPIVGDPVYGRRATPVFEAAGKVRMQRLPLARQFLHAARLGFSLPAGGEWREFSSPLPPDLDATLALLRAGA